jgi:hypothetical protein
MQKAGHFLAGHKNLIGFVLKGSDFHHARKQVNLGFFAYFH